jgi:hypothetical protein
MRSPVSVNRRQMSDTRISKSLSSGVTIHGPKLGASTEKWRPIHQGPRRSGPRDGVRPDGLAEQRIGWSWSFDERLLAPSTPLKDAPCGVSDPLISYPHGLGLGEKEKRDEATGTAEGDRGRQARSKDRGQSRERGRQTRARREARTGTGPRTYAEREGDGRDTTLCWGLERLRRTELSTGSSPFQ